MTHFPALVLVDLREPPTGTIQSRFEWQMEDIEAQITDLMAPYDEQNTDVPDAETIVEDDGYTYKHNPHGYWDWYNLDNNESHRWHKALCATRCVPLCMRYTHNIRPVCDIMRYMTLDFMYRITIVAPDGWHSGTDWGWWGTSTTKYVPTNFSWFGIADDADDGEYPDLANDRLWFADLMKFLNQYADKYAVLIDVHI